MSKVMKMKAGASATAEKLRDQIDKLKAKNKQLKGTRKCGCGKDIFFYTYCPCCRRHGQVEQALK